MRQCRACGLPFKAADLRVDYASGASLCENCHDDLVDVRQAVQRAEAYATGARIMKPLFRAPTAADIARESEAVQLDMQRRRDQRRWDNAVAERQAASMALSPQYRACNGCGIHYVGGMYSMYCGTCEPIYMEPCSTCSGDTGGSWSEPYGCSDCMNTGLQMKEQTSMDTKEIVALVQLTQGADVVQATYINSRVGGGATGGTYHFKNVVGDVLKKDDLCVVQTGDSYEIVRITAVAVPHYAVTCPLGALKHVVQRLDMARLETLLQSEGRAANELRMSELHTRLKSMTEQVGDGFENVSKLLALPSSSAPAKGAPEDGSVVEDEVQPPVPLTSMDDIEWPKRDKLVPAKDLPPFGQPHPFQQPKGTKE